MLLSVENSTLYDVAQDWSQISLTELMVAAVPRSTLSHWGSTFLMLAQRVAVSPSKASFAAYPVPPSDDEVAGLPWLSSTGAALPVPATATSSPAAVAVTAPVAIRALGVNRRGVGASALRVLLRNPCSAQYLIKT